MTRQAVLERLLEAEGEMLRAAARADLEAADLASTRCLAAMTEWQALPSTRGLSGPDGAQQRLWVAALRLAEAARARSASLLWQRRTQLERVADGQRHGRTAHHGYGEAQGRFQRPAIAGSVSIFVDCRR